MTSSKLSAGESFPKITVPKLGGGEISLSTPSNGLNWLMVVFYRGKHCPICTNYLKSLNDLVPELNGIGVDVVALSADPEEKAKIQIDEVNPKFSVGYDLSIEQMQQLGLYISNPRSPQETDKPFAEPGLFVINENNELLIADISNSPATRTELGTLLMGLKFISNPDNNYPIRGTY